MLTFLELTPRLKKLKRRASLEFCVHLDTSQIESSVLQNGVWDFQNSEYLKSYRDFTSFSEVQAKETWEKDIKTMKNENLNPRHHFSKTDDSDLTHI